MPTDSNDQLTPEERKRAQLIRDQLAAGGITDPKKVEDYLSGWDLSQPVYLRTFEPGERLVQHISNPHRNSKSPDPETGQYFGLPGGQTMGEMGIGSGVSGRSEHEFVVVREFTALEGTAAAIPPTMENKSGLSLRGPGGASQVFIADRGLFCLRPAHSIDNVAEQSPDVHLAPPSVDTKQQHEHSKTRRERHEPFEKENTPMNMEHDLRNNQTNQAQTINSDAVQKQTDRLAETKTPETERAHESSAVNSDAADKKPASLSDIKGPEVDREALQREDAAKSFWERQEQLGLDNSRDRGR